MSKPMGSVASESDAYFAGPVSVQERGMAPGTRSRLGMVPQVHAALSEGGAGDEDITPDYSMARHKVSGRGVAQLASRFTRNAPVT